ncbi:MAG: BatD family protein [Phycisphaerales bacterium]|nr:BatD family protein [Phycisphaerales bacterium]
MRMCNLATDNCRLRLRPLRGVPGAAGILIALVWMAGAMAQEARVQVLGDPRDIFVDQPVLVQVLIDFSQRCEAPSFPDILDCSVRFAGVGPDSTFRMDLNGHVTESRKRSYRFELIPRRLGRFDIPPIDVQADGRVIQTQLTSFEARRDDTGELVRAKIVGPEKPIYAGQQIELTLEIQVRAPALERREQRGQGRIRLDAAETWRYLNAATLAPFSTYRSQGAISLPEEGGLLGQWFVYRLVERVVATQPGSLRFDGLIVRMRYPLEYGIDSFGMLTNTIITRVREVAVEPDYGNLTVLPLPEQGRPADFAGAVGTFTIRSAITPGDARVGDPLELSVDIRGDGPLDSLPPPRLDMHPEITANFRIPDVPPAGETIRSARGDEPLVRRYRFTLRPQRPLSELPSIRYPYFDPQRGEYAVAIAPAVPLRVTTADRISDEDVVGLGGRSAASAPPAERPEPGLRPMTSVEQALRGARTDVSRAEALAAVGAPPAALAACFLAGWLVGRRRRSPLLRERRALRAARRRIRAATKRSPRERAAAVHAALVTYLAERRGEPPGRYVGREGAALLTACGAPAEVAQRWMEAVEAAEAASFGGMNNANDDALAERAERVLIEVAGVRMP